MQFTVRTLLLACVLLGSALGWLGRPGILVAVAVLGTLVVIRLKGLKVVRAILLVWCVVTVLIALLLPAHSQSREVLRQDRCIANLARIAAALRAYHGQYGCFPPAYVADASGKPVHSWRVLILPQLGHDELHRAYDFAEPWDGPMNRKLAEQIPGVYQCPSLANPFEACTNYLAVVGPTAAWPGSQAAATSDFHDDLSQTILVLEVSPAKSAAWLEPNDVSAQEAIQDAVRPPPGAQYANHPREGQPGRFAAFADGSVRFLPEALAAADRQSLLTADGNETVDLAALGLKPVSLPQSPGQGAHWTRVAASVVFLVSSVLLAVDLLLPPRRHDATVVPQHTAARKETG